VATLGGARPPRDTLPRLPVGVRPLGRVLHRLWPGRATIWTLLGLFWALSFGATRHLIWAELRGGMINLRGLTPSTRRLIWLGFALMTFLVGALVLSDLWRTRTALVPLTVDADPGQGTRGVLLPMAVVPVGLGLLAFAWSFLLAGALQCHVAIRLAILLVYLLYMAGWTAALTPVTLTGQPLWPG
jgi:hypothetical protein